jgi:putative oxygen-independent coproporphyrinogen III oxidase
LITNFSPIIPTAAYIHIPFCRRRCYYCDFPISVVGDQGGKSSSLMVAEYIAALIRDIQLTTSTTQPLNTLFFGGGTPSLLSPWELSEIIQAISLNLGIAPDAEISMEIDPGTFNQDRLKGYLDAGLNRFSLGVQTFDPELLKICGRSHTLDDVIEAVNIIKQLNVDNFSLDLISGLPHQTLEHCQTSLAQAIAIAPRHLSCYDLVLEPVTAFGKQYQSGKILLPTDDDSAEMYRLTQQSLTAAGYQHYEISNYAQPGYQCRHNRVYWENKPYYGFGMGAASYVDGQRFTRPHTRREYYSWIETGAIIDAPEISEIDYLLETLMLGLRLAEGIDIAQFEPDTLNKIWSCLQPYYRQGWIEVVDHTGQAFPALKSAEAGIPPWCLNASGNLIESQNINQSSTAKIRLNDPEGFLFSNTILATLFEKLA